MRSVTIAICCALLVTILSRQVHAQEEHQPWRVYRLCGRLEHVQRISGRKHSEHVAERRRPLRDASFSLYVRRENELCCNGLISIATSQTRKDGQFEFKNQKPGNYWLTANWGEKDYTTAVVFQPQKDSMTLYSGQGLQLDDQGNPNWWLTRTLD
jgi:Prealbumin-like fold domain